MFQRGTKFIGINSFFAKATGVSTPSFLSGNQFLSTVAQYQLSHFSHTFSLDLTSVEALAAGSDQVAVYGWKHCHYIQVMDAIRPSDNFAITAYSFSDLNFGFTKEGRCFGVLTPRKGIPNEFCYIGLANLVLENWKRIQEQKKVIPLIFCLDMNNNPYPFKVENMLSTDATQNKLYSHKELRRIAFLANHIDNADVRESAKQTFKFVEVKQTNDGVYTLHETSAPHLHPDYPTLFKARQASLKTSSVPQAWAVQLEKEVREYNNKTGR